MKINLLRKQPSHTPQEFLCPISGTLMADPVIVSSGHTFERHTVQACVFLSYSPILFNKQVDFTAIIPNLALKSTILKWRQQHHIPPPKPLPLSSALDIIRRLIIPDHKNVCMALASSSSAADTIEVSSPEEEELVRKLRSCDLRDQEEALITLRELTRAQEETRASLCTPPLLSTLKSLISSRRHTHLQVNAVAALVNLSLEDQNKLKILRSGIVPPVVDLLRWGPRESRDHAAGAIFSLSLEDQNKAALGVLGALPPLLKALRSESESTRRDSALALYHLSLVRSNRVKMIELGAVRDLLGMLETGHMPGRVVLILRRFAASIEGQASMLDSGAVRCLVGLLDRGGFESGSIRENCIEAVYGLSCCGFRFKVLAKEVGALEVFTRGENVGSRQSKRKVRKILEILREKQ